MRDLAEQGNDVRERQWGYVGWDSLLSRQGRIDEAALRLRQGIALDPAFGKIYSNLGEDYVLMGQTEAAMVRDAALRFIQPAASAEDAIRADARTARIHQRALRVIRDVVAVEQEGHNVFCNWCSGAGTKCAVFDDHCDCITRCIRRRITYE